MISLLSVIAVIIRAVSPVAMPNNYHAVNIAQARQEPYLRAEGIIDMPEGYFLPPSIIAQDEFGGEKVAMDDKGDKSSPSEATALRNEEILAIRELIKQFFPKEPLMDKIVACESQFIPTAKSKESSAKGLLQILDGTWKHFECSGDVLNAEDNLACGVKILKGQGLSAWSESFNCWKNI